MVSISQNPNIRRLTGMEAEAYAAKEDKEEDMKPISSASYEVEEAYVVKISQLFSLEAEELHESDENVKRKNDKKYMTGEDSESGSEDSSDSEDDDDDVD